MCKEQTRTAGGVTYRLTRRRVKNINLRVRPDGSVAVSAAPRVPLSVVDSFVCQHAPWVQSALARMQQREQARQALPVPDRDEALRTLTALTQKWLPAFRSVLDGRTPEVKIRDMSSRWGVCHLKKNRITYALRLAAMPPAAQEYVVVHELCHFIVADHSPAFWRQVEQRLPDYKQRRQLLRGV